MQPSSAGNIEASMNEVNVTVDAEIGYFLLRISLGINILVHGLVRIFGPGAGHFAASTSAEFTGTFLPSALTHLFLLVLPFAEAVLGLLILLGLFTRFALAAGALVISALIFGTALRSDWNTVGIQMIYALTYYLLLLHRRYDRFSIDRLRRG
jgi:thiosulfate dehydrogenase [quinone] large subunit